MRAEIDFAGRETLGARKNQEDFYAFEELASGGLLLVLADGVGGEAGGEIASHAAVHGFLDHYAASTGSPASRLASSLNRANESVARVIDGLEKGETNMATTLLALQLENLELRWISVGDSPLLLFRRGELRRLNADHSGKAEGGSHGLGRNELSSALTGGRIHLVDQPEEPISLDEGDLVLAASDGVWTLTLDEIRSVVEASIDQSTAEIAWRLLEAIKAKAKSNQDNATVALIRVA